MKKLLATLLAAVLLASLAGCISAATAAVTTDGLEDGIYSGEGYSFQPPDGWIITAQDGNVTFLHPDYPDNPNNILVSTQERDPEFTGNDQAFFENLYESVLDNVEFLAFEETQFDGHDAYIFQYTFSVEDNKMMQYQYVVNGPETAVTFTFTEVGGDMGDIAEATMETVQIG